MMSGVDKPVVTTSFKQFKDAQLLMDAAKYNDCKRLQDDIWSGVDVNSQDMTGCTALMEATMCGHVDAAKFLLSKGADIDMIDNELRQTALIRAAQSLTGGDCVQLLINHGAQLEIQDVYGNTALHAAVDMRNIAHVSQLVDAGINVNCPGQRGLTPLHLACRRPDISAALEIVPILVKGGANIHAKNKKRQMAHQISPSATWNTTIHQLLNKLEDERKSLKEVAEADHEKECNAERVKAHHSETVGGKLLTLKDSKHISTTCSEKVGAVNSIITEISKIGDTSQQERTSSDVSLSGSSVSEATISAHGGSLERRLLDLQEALRLKLLSSEEYREIRGRVLESFMKA